MKCCSTSNNFSNYIVTCLRIQFLLWNCNCIFLDLFGSFDQSNKGQAVVRTKSGFRNSDRTRSPKAASFTMACWLFAHERCAERPGAERREGAEQRKFASTVRTGPKTWPNNSCLPVRDGKTECSRSAVRHRRVSIHTFWLFKEKKSKQKSNIILYNYRYV